MQAVASQTADQGVASSISARSYTFVEIDYDSPTSAVSRRIVVSYKQDNVHELLFNCLVKLAQEKVVLGELTVST